MLTHIKNIFKQTWNCLNYTADALYRAREAQHLSRLGQHEKAKKAILGE